ncbi:hypothetical protein J6590_051113, partial [Homalodisca vitripennis]
MIFLGKSSIKERTQECATDIIRDSITLYRKDTILFGGYRKKALIHEGRLKRKRLTQPGKDGRSHLQHSCRVLTI